MKKTILLSSILAAGAAFAAVTPTPIEVNSTEVGVIKLAKPTKATLIAVPFLGYEGDAIKVADMINTAELPKDTKLYVPTYSDDNKLTYNVWTLSEDKKWEKPQMTVDIGKVGVEINNNIPEASAATVVRGGSYWLELPAESASGNFYLLGKPTSVAPTSTAVGGKWNLVGNASTATLEALGNAVSKRDQVAIQIDGKFRYYMYMGEKGWCYDEEKTGKTVQIEKLSIPLGQGLWFKPQSGSTINWSTGKIE